MSDILILENDNKDTTNSLSSESFSNKWIIDRLNEYLVSSQSVKTKEKVVIFRLLATMVDAGLSLMKAISILEKQEKNPVVKNILFKVWEELKSWKSLSSAL